jgi:hypothetical protein
MSLKELAAAIKRALELPGCLDCLAIKIMVDNYETLEKKLTAQELKSILAIPAARSTRASRKDSTRIWRRKALM